MAYRQRRFRAMSETQAAMGVLMDVELPVSVCFGRTELTLRETMQVHNGSIIELNAAADSPVEIRVNGRTIARGEVVMVEGSWAVRVQQILPGASYGPLGSGEGA
jgi:flagellar motor switch protein FliN/FliY